MALTGAERLSVFEILDFVPGGAATEMWGILGRTQAVQSFAFTTPAQAIDAYITALDVDSEAAVRELIGEWALVRTSELMLSTAEAVKGVVKDSQAKRGLIRERLQVYIPIYREGEIELRHGAPRLGQMVLRG